MRVRFLLLALTLWGYAGQVQAHDLDLLQVRAEDRRLKGYRLWMSGHMDRFVGLTMEQKPLPVRAAKR